MMHMLRCRNQLSLAAKENVDEQSRIKQLQEGLEAVEREKRETEGDNNIRTVNLMRETLLGTRL